MVVLVIGYCSAHLHISSQCGCLRIPSEGHTLHSWKENSPDVYFRSMDSAFSLHNSLSLSTVDWRNDEPRESARQSRFRRHPAWPIVWKNLTPSQACRIARETSSLFTDARRSDTISMFGILILGFYGINWVRTKSINDKRGNTFLFLRQRRFDEKIPATCTV